jgi:transcriptional regulator
MYSLPYFKEEDPEVVLRFMREHPFAFIAGCDDNKPVATQIPVLLEEREGKVFLAGHMMRQTDHHKAFEKNAHVLAVFTSPHTYVSGTWYDNPQQASTWNYISVHAKGVMRFTDEQGLIDVLKKTTLHFEKNDTSSSTIYDNLPPDYLSKLVKAIVAFEIEVTAIENVFKLSQNRDEKSYHTIMEKLQQQDANGAFIAQEMSSRASQLFNRAGQPVQS